MSRNKLTVDSLIVETFETADASILDLTSIDTVYSTGVIGALCIAECP